MQFYFDFMQSLGSVVQVPDHVNVFDSPMITVRIHGVTLFL